MSAEMQSGDCEFAIRRGALIAGLNAFAVVVASVVYLAQAAKPDWTALPFVLAHVAILAVLAVLVLRKNRAASIVLPVYLVASWIALWWLGHPDGWLFQLAAVVVGAVFLVFGWSAMSATHRWHARGLGSSP